MKHKGWTLLCAIMLLVSCSSRHVPAPVSVLNSQPEHIPSAFEQAQYQVREGDTLFAIAWYSGNDYRDIAKWNNLAAPYVIKIGQTLSLRPPKVQSSSPRPSGQTKVANRKKRIESSKKQAYGEGEKDVSHQAVRVNKSVTTGEFPQRVSKWVWPVEGKIIEPFKQTGDVNKGIDIKADLGTPVVSAAAGKVVYTGNALRGYGNLVIIKHTETFLSAYAHNNSILVKERQWVNAGEQIATVGDSGTTLVKLHFEVRYRGKSLDPMRYLPSRQNNKK